MMICGKNTITPPAPAITPSTTRLLTQSHTPPADSRPPTRLPSHSVAFLMASIGSTDQLNTA